MNKLRFLACVLLLIVCSDASSRPQKVYLFFAEFHNVCEHPVHIALRDFSHFDEQLVEKDVNTGDKVEVLYILAHYMSIESGILPTYSLEISYNNKIIFNSEQFIELLKKLKNNETCSKDRCIWTIKDSSLCPKQ